MLIALVGGTLLWIHAGGGMDPLMNNLNEVKKAVETGIASGKDRDKLLATVSEMEKAAKKYDEETRQSVKDVAKLSERRDSTAEEFTAVLTPRYDETAALQEKLIATRSALKAGLTREQWKKVFPTPSEAAGAGLY